MKIHRISNGELPPENKYVLIYCHERPWMDTDDPINVSWKVAKFIRGISKAEREAMGNSLRARIYRDCDEWGNNLVPYGFEEFGPDTYWGQEIDIWCELPSLEEEADG